MIPVVIVFGFVVGGATGRFLPVAVSVGILGATAIAWGLLAGDPLGILVAGVNGIAGAVVAFLLVELGATEFQSVK